MLQGEVSWLNPALYLCEGEVAWFKEYNVFIEWVRFFV